MSEKVLGNHNNNGHHNHHDHHDHHGHKDKEVKIVVDKNNPVHQNQGFNQGQNVGLSQGFNAGLNQSTQQNYSVTQGYNNKPVNQTSPIQMTLFNPNVDYLITSCNNDGYALDVSQDVLTKGSLLIWKKDKNKSNQRFRIVMRNGWYNIFSVSDMNVVSSISNSNKIGDGLSSLKNVGAQGQCWRFDFCNDQKDKSQFYIRNGFDRYLDVCECKMKNGTAVIQYQFNGNKNQKWRISPA